MHALTSRAARLCVRVWRLWIYAVVGDRVVVVESSSFVEKTSVRVFEPEAQPKMEYDQGLSSTRRL